MGTNYYWYEKDACPACGRADEARHIGKSSAGWVFALHVYPEIDVNDIDDWEHLWATPGSFIRDECDRPVSVEEMRAVIMARARPEQWDKAPVMYESWGQFHEHNFSEKGPAGLLRTNRARDKRCVKHGDGTWDCFTGDFS